MVRGWPGEVWSVCAWRGGGSRRWVARRCGRNWNALRGGRGPGEEGYPAGWGGGGYARARCGEGGREGRRLRAEGEVGSDRARRQGTGAEEGEGRFYVCFGASFQFAGGRAG